MMKQAYAIYKDNKITGIVRNKELSDYVMDIGKVLGFNLESKPISHEDYLNLREKYEIKLLKNLGDH